MTREETKILADCRKKVKEATTDELYEKLDQIINNEIGTAEAYSHFRAYVLCRGSFSEDFSYMETGFNGALGLMVFLAEGKKIYLKELKRRGEWKNERLF